MGRVRRHAHRRQGVFPSGCRPVANPLVVGRTNLNFVGGSGIQVGQRRAGGEAFHRNVIPLRLPRRAVSQRVAQDRRPGVGRFVPGDVQCRRARGQGRCVRRGWRFGHIGHVHRHGDGGIDRGIVLPADIPAVAHLHQECVRTRGILVVQRRIPAHGDLAGGGVDGKPVCVRPGERVGQWVVVRIRGRHRCPDGRSGCRVFRHGAGGGGALREHRACVARFIVVDRCGQGRRSFEQNAVRQLPEPEGDGLVVAVGVLERH